MGQEFARYRSYNPKSLARGKLKQKYPTMFGTRDLSCLEEMKGATIVNIGIHLKAREGGFGIDFIRSGETEVRRLVLGYTELGEWVDYLGPIKT